MDKFAQKTLLIVGGTGSFGNAVLKRFLSTEVSQIRIFSRDEKKQEDMRIKFSDDRLKFYIGDVRDKSSIYDAMEGVDYVFHAAALKQVPSCEFFPLEAVKTNVLGTGNVIDAAVYNKVKKVIVLSTDKAAYPINAMGMSKALMEKVAVAKGRDLKTTETTICRTRYGNVMASRGSVIPLFIEQIKRGGPITITEPKMTRYMMSLDDAVDLVVFAFLNGKQGDLFVQKSPATTIKNLAEALIEISGKKNISVKNIGIRHGEKLYETLVTREEMVNAEDLGQYYRITSDNRSLNYAKFETKGDDHLLSIDEYNSKNTRQLNLDQTVKLLLKLSEVKELAVYAR